MLTWRRRGARRAWGQRVDGRGGGCRGNARGVGCMDARGLSEAAGGKWRLAAHARMIMVGDDKDGGDDVFGRRAPWAGSGGVGCTGVMIGHLDDFDGYLDDLYDFN